MGEYQLILGRKESLVIRNVEKSNIGITFSFFLNLFTDNYFELRLQFMNDCNITNICLCYRILQIRSVLCVERQVTAVTIDKWWMKAVAWNMDTSNVYTYGNLFEYAWPNCQMQIGQACSTFFIDTDTMGI